MTAEKFWSSGHFLAIAIGVSLFSTGAGMFAIMFAPLYGAMDYFRIGFLGGAAMSIGQVILWRVLKR